MAAQLTPSERAAVLHAVAEKARELDSAMRRAGTLGLTLRDLEGPLGLSESATRTLADQWDMPEVRY
jgi:hypothetical protein